MKKEKMFNLIQYLKMTRNIIYISILILGYLTFPAEGHAQVRDTTQVTTDLPAEEVEVIKLFQARLEDARKINIPPSSQGPRALESFDYTVSITPLSLEYLDPVIRPIGMPQEEKARRRNGFLELGMGSINTLDGKLGFHLFTDQETKFNANADFLRQKNNQRPLQANQNLKAGINASHNFNKLFALQVNTAYQKDDLHLFGGLPDSLIDTSGIYDRNLSMFNIGTRIKNPESNVYSVDYDLGFNYNRYNVLSSEKFENNYIFDLKSKKQINDYLSISLDGLMDLSSIGDTSRYAYNNYAITPGMRYSRGKANISANLISFYHKEDWSFLPNIQVSYNLWDYKVIPYIFWNSEVRKNNMPAMYTYNPYLDDFAIFRFRNSTIQRYGAGAKGIYKGLSYDINLGYGSNSYLIMYETLKEFEQPYTFDIVADSANVFDVKGGIDYRVNDNFDINSDFYFVQYDLKNEARPWHLPNYRVDVELSYKALNNKLEIAPAMHFRDAPIVKDVETGEKELIPLVDFNLGIHYKIKNNFRLYGKVNNILSSEYQQWEGYSQYGVHGIIGLRLDI